MFSTNMPEDARAVWHFWLGDETQADAAYFDNRMKLWFQKNEAADNEIRHRFAALLEEASRGHLQAWQADPHARLALIILLDQFSRNLYRNNPRAWAQDERALALSVAAIDSGMDRLVPLHARMFYYLPLEHAEDLNMQDRCVELFKALLEEVPANQKELYSVQLNYAEQHRDVVAKFGRFPHRNAILGRTSSVEEEAYLAQPGSGF